MAGDRGACSLVEAGEAKRLLMLLLPLLLLVAPLIALSSPLRSITCGAAA